MTSDLLEIIDVMAPKTYVVIAHKLHSEGRSFFPTRRPTDFLCLLTGKILGRVLLHRL